MGAVSVELQQMLDRGALRWARSVSRVRAAGWSLSELAGRVVELRGGGASAAWTAAGELVLAAQRAKEPVAWVSGTGGCFYPPDLAASGVDLSALAVLRVGDVRAAMRAGDVLLRSGAFGLVVFEDWGVAAQPLSVQQRLANLAREHDALLLCLEGEVVAGRGSLASLRAEVKRERVAAGRFRYRVEVRRDKRRSEAWSYQQECDGPPGLR